METNIRVPKIMAHGSFDGDQVMVAYHTPTSVVFRHMSGGRTFPIYLVDWPEFSGRLDFSDLHYAPLFTHIWD